jgi:maltooligosyltrehalose trehalohydrolase
MTAARRRLQVGAEPCPRGVTFRVWAPHAEAVEVVLDDGRRVAMPREPGGYASVVIPGIRTGDRYRFSLDRGEPLADPASRSQPAGPFGPSQVIDPGAFPWTDHGWRGVRHDRIVCYELHVGTFTPAGTFDAAIERLPHLAELGVTMVEIMPVAEFPGRFGWGYDGVLPFAPTRLYGPPDAFRRFVDRAHALGIGVILDVVYNHLGPGGNVLPRFGPYLSERHVTEWGQGLNYDGPESRPVREYIASNAAYWIDEFHLDGLRLDATQGIVDDSPTHIVTELAARARAAAGDRPIFVVAENEPQEAWHVRPREAGGAGLDAMWNDDFHHTAMVALLGRREAYMQDYGGSPQELAACLRHGFLYQGQHQAWTGRARGTPTLDVEPSRFVVFIQNHDQIANTGFGRRVHAAASPATLRAITALVLLGPNLPMLFQGQEFQSSAPFCYFADHGAGLGRLLVEGRARFLGQFPSLATEESQARLPLPHSEEVFAACKLDWAEALTNAHVLALHRDLLRLRREDPVLARSGLRVETAVLGRSTLLVRWIGAPAGDRLLLVTLDARLMLGSLPEPLLAPPAGAAWSILWSSEWPRYGGFGQPEVLSERGLELPARSAVLLAA